MISKRIKIIIPILVICCLLLVVYFWIGIYQSKESGSAKSVTFSIQRGEGSREIALNLEKVGLIKWESSFRVYVYFKGVAGKLQAGDYQISPSMNIPEMVNKFVNGDVIKEKITFPEGFNLKEIKKSFESSEFLQTIDLEKLKIIDFKDEFDFLNDLPDEASLEGFLFPDTYFFESDMKEREIAEIFLNNFEKKLTPYRPAFSGTDAGLTLFNVIKMASLIEKEVITYEDKEIVSGIFWKRLKSGKPLQSCATVAYILNTTKRQYSFEETRIVSPYNTYLNLGLPSGPICNPGLESILAALYPEASEYWYFLSTPEGKTIFSKTFEEHNIAKAKYLR